MKVCRTPADLWPGRKRPLSVHNNAQTYAQLSPRRPPLSTTFSTPVYEQVRDVCAGAKHIPRSTASALVETELTLTRGLSRGQVDCCLILFVSSVTWLKVACLAAICLAILR